MLTVADSAKSEVRRSDGDTAAAAAATAAAAEAAERAAAETLAAAEQLAAAAGKYISQSFQLLINVSGAMVCQWF